MFARCAWQNSEAIWNLNKACKGTVSWVFSVCLHCEEIKLVPLSYARNSCSLLRRSFSRNLFEELCPVGKTGESRGIRRQRKSQTFFFSLKPRALLNSRGWNIIWQFVSSKCFVSPFDWFACKRGTELCFLLVAVTERLILFHANEVAKRLLFKDQIY